MNKDKEKILFSFLGGVLFGITLFSYHQKRRGSKNLEKIRESINNGLQVDRESLSNDGHLILSDLHAAYKKIK